MANQPTKYRKFVVGAASAALVASAVAPVAFAAEFTDVKDNNSHKAAIDALSDAKVISGYPDGTFQPNKTLTRSDVVKLMGKWLIAEGYDVPTDYKTKPRFADLKTTSNDELLKMSALVFDNGVFNGTPDGKLDPNGNITRENMAIVLVRAFDRVHNMDLASYVAKQKFDKDVTDLGKAKAEARPAIDVLDFFDITNPAAPEFNPKATTTRGQFASFLFKTLNTDFSDVKTESPYGKAVVKSVNNTHVEVTFDKAVDKESLSKLKFTIDGLNVSNAVVKQTDDKTVILTTAEQVGGTKYTVSLNNDAIGSFTGIAAVVPEKVSMITTSQQGVIGKEVTVRADINQKTAGVPVTFNVVSATNSNLNKDQVVEVMTNADGIAEYTYTRYAVTEDVVTAYATGKPAARTSGKVYWANKIQLSLEELTVGNNLSNDTKKSYKVNGAKNTTYYIAIKENLDVTPDKVTKVMVQDHATRDFVTPFELASGNSKKFATVRTNENGEGSFTIFGANLTATPIVYLPSSAGNLEAYSSTALQTKAEEVKFSQVTRVGLTVSAVGTANSAEYVNTPKAFDGNSTGGRVYEVTVTDKDGKVAPAGSVAYVTFEEGNIAGDIYFSTEKQDFEKVGVDTIKPVVVGKDGKAQFRVAGKGAASFVTPTVFLNTAGTTSPVKFDKTGKDTDVFQVATSTYFKSAEVNNAVLTVEDEFGRQVSSVAANKDAVFTYQSVDQNGFAYRPLSTTGSTTQIVWKPVTLPNGQIGYVQDTITVPGTAVTSYTLAFDVTSTFGEATVKKADGTALAPTQNQGKTKTYKVESDAEGKAIVRVTSSAADTVNVNVTGASSILPTKSASVTFTSSNVVPSIYTGVVKSYDSVKQTLTFDGKEEVKYAGETGVNYEYRNLSNAPIATADDFIKELNKPGVKVTREVKSGVTTFYIVGQDSTVTTPPTDTAPKFEGKTLSQEFTVGDAAITLTSGQLATGTKTVSLATPETTNATVATATVSLDGKSLVITPVGKGNADVTVNVTDGTKTSTATVKVSVKEKAATPEQVKVLTDAIKATEDKKLVEADFTPATWTAFDNALKAAKATATNATATATDVEKAKTDLEKAETALEKVVASETPAITLFKYSTAFPGFGSGTAVVQLDTKTPEKYEVKVKGTTLVYDADVEAYSAVLPGTADTDYVKADVTVTEKK